MNNMNLDTIARIRTLLNSKLESLENTVGNMSLLSNSQENLQRIALIRTTLATEVTELSKALAALTA